MTSKLSQSALRTTLRRLKLPKFSGRHAPRRLTNFIFVSCQRSARRKSSMTVTCLHTGTMTSILSQSASEPLWEGSKFQNFLWGGGGGGGACPPDPPTNCGLYRPHSLIHCHSPKLKILDRTLGHYVKTIAALSFNTANQALHGMGLQLSPSSKQTTHVTCKYELGL